MISQNFDGNHKCAKIKTSLYRFEFLPSQSNHHSDNGVVYDPFAIFSWIEGSQQKVMIA